MKCPHCQKDISEALVVSEAAKILHKRSSRRLSPDEARAMQAKSVAARLASKTQGVVKEQ